LATFLPIQYRNTLIDSGVMNSNPRLIRCERSLVLGLLLTVPAIVPGFFFCTHSSAEDTPAGVSRDRSSENQSFTDKPETFATSSEKISVLKTKDATALKEK